jgi:hypothetical protein
VDGKESPLVGKNFVARSYEMSAVDLELYGHSTMFELVGAADWIAHHRMPRQGPLDTQSTADSLGVPVLWGHQAGVYGRTYGLPTTKQLVNPLEIYLRPDMQASDALITFGHEVGHIYLSLILGVDHSGTEVQEIEDFCELFGREMLLPKSELLHLTEVNELVIADLMSAYQVDLKNVLYQLVRAGKMPRKFNFKIEVPDDGGSRLAGKNLTKVYCFDCVQRKDTCLIEEAESLPALDLRSIADGHRVQNCKKQREWTEEPS